jgi:hypothetical protein
MIMLVIMYEGSWVDKFYGFRLRCRFPGDARFQVSVDLFGIESFASPQHLFSRRLSLGLETGTLPEVVRLRQ